MFLKPLALSTLVAFAAIATSNSASADEPQVAHIVFFTLANDTPAERKALLVDIKKYLSNHEGTVYFSAGAIADDMNRSVNDREFQVSLNLIFANRKAHDAYNDHARHEEFKTKNKTRIKKVRVFDSYLPAMIGMKQAKASLEQNDHKSKTPK